MTEPKISALVVSHNQEKFIERALTPIENQVCAFPIEVVIADDESRDRTRKLCEDWQRRSGLEVRLLEATERLGVLPREVVNG